MIKLPSYSIEEICAFCSGELVQNHAFIEIRHLSLDSRRIHHAKHSVFIAIKGDRHNGHSFIKDAYQQGVRNFIISEDSRFLQEKKVNYIKVAHSVDALQKIAKAHREKFNFPVIGITGSNGKTTVKEWLFQLLQSAFNVTRSPKSYNSQIGVPLSIWNFSPTTELGIIEAGISAPTEMKRLAEIVSPTMGVFTSIGSAHQENFASISDKINEKLALFEHSQSLIVCSAHQEIIEAAQQKLPSTQLITWGKNTSDFLVIKRTETQKNRSLITAEFEQKEFTFEVPFKDRASIENVCHAITTALFLGVSPEVIQQEVSDLQPLEMRLESKKGKFNTTLINDYYSADLNSLEIALDVLNYQHQHPKKTLILSELVESGLPAQEMITQIAHLLNTNKIERVIAVGPQLEKLNQQLTQQWFRHYNSTTELLEDIRKIKFRNEAILIKGARKFQFEKVSRWLEERNHETTLEVNLTAIVHNLNYFKGLLQPNTRLMVMVKALSYGTGVYELANVLAYHNVDYLAVAYVDEGIELRKAGIQLPIMVLSPHDSELDIALHYRLEPEIYSLEMLDALVDSVSEEDLKSAKIHICLDTGMRRLGFQPDEIPALTARLQRFPQLQVAAIYTHLVATDDATHDAFTHQQVSNYQAMLNQLLPILPNHPILHVLNSGGIQRFPEYQFDMVRLGIGLHGIGVAPEFQANLRPAARLKTTISQVKSVCKGETIGYSRAGIAQKDGKTATISIGYADGVSRQLGNGKGVFYINGQAVRTIGNICMDMTMLDVSDLDVSIGDEVIIFDENHTVIDLAAQLNTIPYEILTSISQRVKRIFYHES